MEQDDTDTKETREWFREIGSDTTGNNSAIDSITVKDGTLLIDGENIADILWRVEDDYEDDTKESKALRIAVLHYTRLNSKQGM